MIVLSISMVFEFKHQPATTSGMIEGKQRNETIASEVSDAYKSLEVKGLVTLKEVNPGNSTRKTIIHLTKRRMAEITVDPKALDAYIELGIPASIYNEPWEAGKENVEAGNENLNI